MDYKIPVENHGKLLVPDYSDIPSAIERNENRYKNAKGGISGIHFLEFRTKVLSRIGRLLNISGDIQQPILMTAHQPGLWHPGILYKNAVAKKFSGKYFLISLNVDSDVTSPVAFKIPFYLNGKFNNTEVIIFPNDEKRTIERLEKLPRQKFDELFDEIEQKTLSLPDNTVALCFKRFRDIHTIQYNQSVTFSNWLTNCRREYYPVPALHELDLSILCRTDEYRLFVLDIIRNCRKFFDIYNSALDRYREEHGIRYNVNPFPNLEGRGDNTVEIPFWFINKEDGRESLFAQSGHGISLMTAEKTLIAETGNIATEKLDGIEIRPKALCLTMFMRLFASSIFIHGVSGGNYDEVTDFVIRQYFGCEPPEYIVASRTEFLPLGIEADTAGKAKQLKDEIRNMQFNPDEYVSTKNPLVAEKHAIIKKSAGNTSKDEFRRLKEIRLILVKEIKREIEAKQSELEAIEQEASKTEHVMRRDFPYFFYPTELLED